MDHKAFVSALPRDTLAALNETEDAAGLWHLAGHMAVIFGFGLWIAQGWMLWQLALVGQGIAICFLFTLEHEATHKTPFRSALLNEWVGRIAGFLIVQPFEWFRYFHLAHHRYTNMPGKDPELVSGAKPETRLAYVVHVSGQPFLRLYLLAAHGRCAFVANMFENTRSTYTNRIVRFLAWNMPYHVEHHTLPQVPFHKLPMLHTHMRDHLEITARGYGEFSADYASHLR